MGQDTLIPCPMFRVISKLLMVSWCCCVSLLYEKVVMSFDYRCLSLKVKKEQVVNKLTIKFDNTFINCQYQ